MCVLYWNPVGLEIILCRLAVFCAEELDHGKTTEMLICSPYCLLWERTPASQTFIQAIPM